MILAESDLQRSHWRRHAATWHHFGPPLRPQAQDMAHVRSLCSTRAAKPPRALLLGVTPEYALIPWPAGTSFTAVDKCPEMIARVWPHQRVPVTFRALEGDWTALPVADQSMDVVMGDGISTVLPHWSMMEKIVTELSRVCAPGATVILRLFVKPDVPDSLQRLMADAQAGRLQGFHAFKLRLLMVLQESLATGVAPRTAWQMWHRLRLQHAACIEAQRWSAEAMDTIEAYAASNDTYWFPTLNEARRSFAHCFKVREIRYSDYELADRCPLFVLERRT